MADPVRRSYEQLLRRLLALPHAPAVVVLSYYSWFYAQPAGAQNVADGPGGPFGCFYQSAEAGHLTFAQVGLLSIAVLSSRHQTLNDEPAAAAVRSITIFPRSPCGVRCTPFFWRAVTVSKLST